MASLLKNFENGSPKIIKILTTFAYILSLCAFLIHTKKVFIKWHSKPDIALKDRLIPAYEIPAPAITICPPNTFKRGFINFTEYFIRQKDPVERLKINLTVKEQNFLAASIQICAPNVAKTALNFTQNRTEKNIVKLLEEPSFNRVEIFLACIFKSMTSDCGKFFNKVLTDDGLCYSFNMQGFNEIFDKNVISSDFDYFKRKEIVKSLDDKELMNITFNDSFYTDNHWSLEKGYNNGDERIPYRAIPTLDIKFITKLNYSDTFDMCLTRREGYKIIYHLPNEIPTMFHDYDFFDFGQKSINIISAQRYKTDASLKKYSIESRKCFFEDERKLKFFKSYTKAHCNLECLANFTFHECGCVKFSMPHSNDTPVCDLNMVPCYLNAFSRWPKFDLNSNQTAMPCNCYPPCTDIKYSVKYKATSILSGKTSTTIRKLGNEFEERLYAYYQIKCNNFQYDEVESFVAYLLQNFIADCGGLLGLFMGISLLSTINCVLIGLNKYMNRKKIENCEESKKDSLSEVLILKSPSRPSTPLWIIDYEYQDINIKNIPTVVSKNNLGDNQSF